jgi:RNA polymerase sigma factor (sigma-70 family)
MISTNKSPRDRAVDHGDDLAVDIERVANRDFAALERIHRRFGGKLAAICLRITGSSETAEDALQEVYIKLWNRAGSYDRNLSRPMVWLSTLARNSAIDLARAQRRSQSASLPDDYDEVDHSPPVDDCLIEKERQMKAVELLETLAEEQREYIRDIYFKGLSYTDLAEQHGIPVGTVKSRIHRGLVAIKKAWKID